MNKDRLKTWDKQSRVFSSLVMLFISIIITLNSDHWAGLATGCVAIITIWVGSYDFLRYVRKN